MEPLALYVHWPFCLAKCPYCDFNSHVREAIPTARVGAALQRELTHEAARTGRRRLRSIFFGGGTPSLMDPDDVARLIAAATTCFDPEPDLEITLEANPTSVEAGRLRAFAEAGVNRCSLGVQSLDDAALRALGRRHDAHDAIAALELARRIFPRLSFDLIYARPGHSVPAWRAELRQALALAADHLSLYQLTIEPGTQFEVLHRRGALVLPDPDTGAALYEATAEEAEKFGLFPYEISNYAKPGAESRHNLAYWRYTDYAGIGPGAHGRLSDANGMFATSRHRAPETWLDAVDTHGHGLAECQDILPADRAREALLMGLRLVEGIGIERFETRTGVSLRDALDPVILEASIEASYLVMQNGVLAATAEGRLRLDALLPRLLL